MDPVLPASLAILLSSSFEAAYSLLSGFECVVTYPASKLGVRVEDWVRGLEPMYLSH